MLRPHALAVAFSLIASQSAGAQAAALTGIVRDEGGRPISDVQLVIEPDARQTTSDDSGRFRLTSPRAGEYQLIARRMGFIPTRQRVRLTQAVLEVEIMMRQLPLELLTMVASATHVGLTGVVLDSAGIGARAMLRVFHAYLGNTSPDHMIARGSHQIVATAPDGAFFAPLAPATYVLLVEREGRTLGTVRVYIPPAGRRCIVVRLDAFDRRGLQRAEGCTARDLDAPADRQLSTKRGGREW